MEQIFLEVLHMSLSASVVILAVLLVRMLLTGAPKKWSYLLWSVVGFRLICPVSFRAAFSIFSVAPQQTSPTEHVVFTAPMNPVPVVEPNSVTVTPTPIVEQTATVHLWPTLGMVLWCVGVAALLIYSLVQYFRLRSLLLDAVRQEEGVWQSDRISSPFLLGLVHPKIYLPTGTEGETRRYVLAHERVHLQRGDHWIKTLSFLLLAVHWFNPLCWLSYVLMNRDMELSCDERVLMEYGDIARSYSYSLLHFASGKRFPQAGMLAFGESDVKRRVQNALKWKQPKRWATIFAALVCVLAVAVCAANPKAADPEREAIEAAAKRASELSISQSQVVDQNGALIPDVAATYEDQLRAVFTEDSGYIDQYADLMRQIVSNFGAATDVVMDSGIKTFKVQKLEIDGDQATLVGKLKVVQTYIPHREDGGYDVIYAASKETVTYTLQKGVNGQWRVQHYDMKDYIFGTPLEMIIPGKYVEKTFQTREEACRYAATSPLGDKSTYKTENAATRRMRALQAGEILDFAGSNTMRQMEDFPETIAAVIRNAAEHVIALEDIAPAEVSWFYADLYLTKNPKGAGTVSDYLQLEAGLTESVVYVHYYEPKTQVRASCVVEDEQLYWLLRESYNYEEGVVTEVLAPYWDIIHSRAQATVERAHGLTGYDLLTFRQVETLSDDAHSYDVYYWGAAYQYDDLDNVFFAGGTGLDSQGRIVGLNEEETYFTVRDDGEYRFVGYEIPFGIGGADTQSRCLELIRYAFDHPLT